MATQEALTTVLESKNVRYKTTSKNKKFRVTSASFLGGQAAFGESACPVQSYEKTRISANAIGGCHARYIKTWSALEYKQIL